MIGWLYLTFVEGGIRSAYSGLCRDKVTSWAIPAPKHQTLHQGWPAGLYQILHFKSYIRVTSWAIPAPRHQTLHQGDQLDYTSFLTSSPTSGWPAGLFQLLDIKPYISNKEDGVSMTGSSIIKIILGILFESFLNSIPSVRGSKVRGGVLFLL